MFYSAYCSHHVSKDSLQALVRGGHPRDGAKCPQPGCKGRWTLASSTLDTVFQLKMERFFRTAEMQSQMLSPRADAVDLDEDE